MKRAWLICIGLLGLAAVGVIFYAMLAAREQPAIYAHSQTRPDSGKPGATSSINAPSSQTAIAQAPDARLEAILANKNRIPPRTILRSLTLSDEEALLGEYQRTPTTDLRSLTWALAAVGGDAAATVLQRSLTEGRGDLEIDSEEFGILHNHLLALGFISARSDVAHRFLTEATQADYWTTHRTWHSKEPKEEVGMDYRLASLAISSLGLSGRDDVESQLEKLKQQPIATLKEIRSGLMSGAFHAELAAEIGHQASLDLWSSSLDAILDRTVQWAERNPKGRQWKQWNDQLIQAIAQKKIPGGSQP